MNDTPDHSRIYAVVGELVMIANAIDHLLNNALIEVLNLEPSPLLEPVIATLEPARKIEILKSRAKHINNPDWKKASQAFCAKAESVYRQRNIVCHTPAFPEGDTWKFKPVAAAKLLNKLDLETRPSKAFRSTTSRPRSRPEKRRSGQGSVFSRTLQEPMRNAVTAFPVRTDRQPPSGCREPRGKGRASGERPAPRGGRGLCPFR
jgi:hypothetical protein